MKMKPCVFYGNSASGRVSEPIKFPSISEAVKYGKESFWFAWRVYNEAGKLIRRGYGK